MKISVITAVYNNRISNGSIGRVFLKSREDYRVLRQNKIGGLSTLVLKNLQKLPQFFNRF